MADHYYELPQVGDVVTVRGIECRVYHVLPCGTVDVEATDGSGRCFYFRLSGGIVRVRKDSNA